MKKLLILAMMLIFLSSLFAIESEPSEVVGFVKYDLVAGDYNMMAVPMEINFPLVDAENPMVSDLANYIGAGVEQIVYWNTATSAFKFYTGNEATDFPIAPGDALMLKLAAGDDQTFYSAGANVAEVASNFAADYNMLMVPLNRADLTMASELAADIGADIEQIMFWNTATSAFKFYTGNEATDFPIEIGDALMIKSSSEIVDWNAAVRDSKLTPNRFKQ